MRLTEFISKDHIAADLRSKTKPEALSELTRLLLGQLNEVSHKEALEKILTREAIESTGIGGGIAVPHAPMLGLSKLTCAVGRLARELDFKSIDKEPVRLVFLICYPPNQQTVYLNFLATIARLLREPSAFEALAGAPTPAEILALLELHSESMVKPEEQVSSQREAAALDESAIAGPVCSEIVLLARLELCVDMLESAESGQEDIARRIENIKALIDPATVERFEQLKLRKRPAVVAVEGRVCQGCAVVMPKQLSRELRADDSRVYSCPQCKRFIYAA